jgi:hypothetical protein
MPHFITIETCSFGLPIDISFGLARFERNPFLHKISLGFKPRALELFGLFLFGVILPSIPFPFMAQLLVKELVVLLEPEFVTASHIRKTFHFHDGLG